jgi:hypothetical protein
MEKSEISQSILDLAEKSGDAKFEWRRASAILKQTEGQKYLDFKADLKKRGERFTTDDLRAMVKADQGCYDAALVEAAAEALHEKTYERLMSIKKIADIMASYS